MVRFSRVALPGGWPLVRAECDENTRRGIPFDTIEMVFDSRDEAVQWIIRNQLGRRNLSPDAASLLRGRLYNSQKKAVTNPSGQNQHSEVECQNGPQPTTAARLSDELGVSERTIKRDGAFASAVEELTPFIPDIAERVMRGEVEAPRREVVEVATKQRGSFPAGWQRSPVGNGASASVS